MTTHIICTGRTSPAMLYTIVEVLPGVRLAMLPGEDIAEVAERLAWFFDETERRPGMDDEPSPDEAAELDAWAEGDPHLARYLLESGAPSDFAEAVLAVKAGREVWSSGVDWTAVIDERWGD